MHYVFTSLAVLFAVVVGGSVLYLLTILAAATVAKVQARFRPDRSEVEGALPRLLVLIPAHNEATVIRSTLRSLALQDYDAELFDVVVVADNCTDDTACIAESMGATVLERTDEMLRGKGHALNWAIARLMEPSGMKREAKWPAAVEDNETGKPDAFVIVDADTEAAPDFLSALAVRIAAIDSSRPLWALQGRYGVLNTGEVWRPALMAGAFELINHVRPLGKDRLGLTVGLMGNGMAFSRELLGAATWSGSLTEDIDFALDLCRNQRIRVVYVPEARVRAVMPSTTADAASQRSRWENGRGRLVRERALPLFVEGIRRRNGILVGAALDLMIPPLVELSTLMLIWAVLACTGWITGGLPHAEAWVDAVAVASIGLFVYLLGGLLVAGASSKAYFALIFAPFYGVWKLCLYLGRAHRSQRGVWLRTSRAPMSTESGVDTARPAYTRSDAE